MNLLLIDCGLDMRRRTSGRGVAVQPRRPAARRVASDEGLGLFAFPPPIPQAVVPAPRDTTYEDPERWDGLS